MTNTTAPAGIGHNDPPLEPLADVLSPVRLNKMLALELAPLEERAEVLAASCGRFIAQHPAIETDDQDAKATEVLAVCQRFTAKNSGRVDAARIAIKAPVLAAQRTIDGAFPPVAQIVLDAVAPIVKASMDYKLAKEAKVRAAREAEAKRLADEAAERERKAELAKAAAAPAAFQAAAVAWDAAEKAQAAAQAKPAELTRARGGDFGTSGLQYDREVAIEAPHLVPAQYCTPSLDLIKKAAGKANTPIPTIPGVKIVDVPRVRVGR